MDADREFWMTIRRAFIMVIRAIEKKYGIAPVDTMPLEEISRIVKSP